MQILYLDWARLKSWVRNLHPAVTPPSYPRAISHCMWNGWLSMRFPITQQQQQQQNTPKKPRPKTPVSCWAKHTLQSVRNPGTSCGWSEINCLLVLTAGPQPCSPHAFLSALWIRFQKFNCRQKLVCSGKLCSSSCASLEKEAAPVELMLLDW